MHPAHVEPEGMATGAVGVSARFATGDAASTLRQAQENSAAGKAPPASAADTYRQGALVAAALAPGVSPLVSGRVGLGIGSEAGLAYSGRTLRIDGRHAFQDQSWALSIGLGGQALLARQRGQSSDSLRGLSLGGVSGYGFDVPVVAGWRSAAGLFSAWAGLRVGFEKQRGQIGLDPEGTGVPAVSWSARQLWGGGMVGLMAGFRRVFVVLELDAAYHSAHATAGDAPIDLAGLTLTPAAALLGKF